MTSNPGLTIRNLRSRAVKSPMPLPLQTSSGTISIAPLAPLELERKLQAQFRLLGAKGIAAMALAGIAWDEARVAACLAE